MAESYEMQGYQRGVKICSVIILIIGILGIVASLLVIVLGPIFGVAATDPSVAQDVATDIGDTSANAAGGLAVLGLTFTILGVVSLVTSLVDIIMAVLGFRGANDATKIGPFWVLSIVGFVLAIGSTVTSIVMTAMGGGGIGNGIVTSIVSNGLSILLSAFCLYFSTKIHGLVKYGQ